MDILIKYCEEKYNIYSGCGTVKLGTLDYYREMDPSFISDPEEASFEFTNVGKPLTLSKEQTEKITEGKWINAPFKVEKDGNIVKKLKFPNCYIFCASMLHDNFNKRAFAKSFKSAYDSSYLITDISLFARSLASLLQNQFKLEDINLDISQKLENLPLIEFQNIQLSVIMNPVAYVDSRKIILDQQNIDNSLNMIDRKNQILFLKEKKDSYQREFRIAFIYTHPLLGMVPVKKDPKILKFNIMHNAGKYLGLEG